MFSCFLMRFSSSSIPSIFSTRYNRIAILLHWLLGALLVGVFGVGLYMVDLPFSPQKIEIYNWHKWVGVCVLGLSLLRLLWRLNHRPPTFPQVMVLGMPRWQKQAHRVTDFALYLLLRLWLWHR